MIPEVLLDPFQESVVPLAEWVDHGLRWLVDNYRPFFQSLRWPIDQLLRGFDGLLHAVPPTVLLALVSLAAWRISGLRLAISVLAALTFVGLIGAWSETMTTLSIVFTAVTVCVVLGLPIGILSACSDGLYKVVRPMLDGMQTIPPFVYLVPVVMLFGIGNVPGVIVTVVFAIPPLIRLVNLGIRQVPSDVVETSLAFGASPAQLMLKVQLPLALPTIMAGLNQTLMMALSMVVIASMIAVGGLGQMVLRGIGRLDMGLATVGGLGIVILAIVMDRMTQAIAENRRRQRKGSLRGKAAAGFPVKPANVARGRKSPPA